MAIPFREFRSRPQITISSAPAIVNADFGAAVLSYIGRPTPPSQQRLAGAASFA